MAPLGNHLPRRCGIATFAGDLCQAISAERSALDCFVVAMNDVGRLCEHPATVRSEIAENDLPSYRRAADFLDVNDVDVVLVPRLPQAFVVAGSWLHNEGMTTVGIRSLEWPGKAQTSEDGCFAPIGSNGFFWRGEAKASFDQQPMEACAMVSTCVEAARATSDGHCKRRARHAFDWFIGQNQLQQSPYNAAIGGRRDGPHADPMNENQGAEPTLSFQLALLEMLSIELVPAVRLVAQEAK